MSLMILAVFASPPPAPPVDQRLTELENRMAKVESRLGIVHSPAPAAVATEQPPPVTVKSGGQTFTAPASDFNAPTWHYPPGTVMVRDANGVLVPSQPATTISYPDGRVQKAPPPDFYAPPPVQFMPQAFAPPMRFGGACVGRS